MELNINGQSVSVANSAVEVVPVIDLCDLLKTHTPIQICYDFKICRNCGALLNESNRLITSLDWDSYRPPLAQLRDVQGGEEYLKTMRSWILSAKSSGVALAYSEAANDFSDDIEAAIKDPNIRWQYIHSLLGHHRQGKARSLMIKYSTKIHEKSRKRYYFEYEVEWYNTVARNVTKRRVELNDRNVVLRDQMKLHKGVERQKLVDELEENIAKRKRLKDVERGAYKVKMAMRQTLNV